ncbi:MAG: hypothetical protein AAF621_06700 [Pseudomonadota bacterium]
MSRIYEKPRSGVKERGRYDPEKARELSRLRQIDREAEETFSIAPDDDGMIRRQFSTNDARGLNQLGRAFKPILPPDQSLLPPHKVYGRKRKTVPFPLTADSFKEYAIDDNGEYIRDNSTGKPIEVIRDHLPAGGSRQMRLSDRMNIQKQAIAKSDMDAINAQYLKKARQAVFSGGLVPTKTQFMQAILQDIGKGGALTPNTNSKNKMEFDYVPEKLAKASPAQKVPQSPKPPKSVKKAKANSDLALPALIERNDYLPDGSKLTDNSIFYAGSGYLTVHHNLGMGVYKTIKSLEEFISKNPGETPPRQQGLEPIPLDFTAQPTKPARAFLKAKGFTLKKLDDLTILHSVFFRNNDYSIDQLKKADEVMEQMRAMSKEGGEFDKFLKALPKSYRDQVKEPFEMYSKRILRSLRKIVSDYDKYTKPKAVKYVRRVLLDHKNNNAFDNALKDLAQLYDTKNYEYLTSHQRVIAEPAIELLKHLNTAVSYSEMPKFSHTELMKHTSELPEAISKTLKAIAYVSQDPRLDIHPNFKDKLSDVIFALDRILTGPLSKDLNIWHTARERSAELPKRHPSTAKDINVLHGLPRDSMGGDLAARAPKKRRLDKENIPPANTAQPSLKKPAEQSNGNKSKSKDKSGKRKLERDEGQYLKYAKTMPQPYDLVRPLGAAEEIRPAPFDDPFLRETQNLAEWSDYAGKMKAKLDTLNQIGNTIQEMAMMPTGRPDPEFVALGRRRRRLTDLRDIIQEVPHCNKIAQQIERATLKAQHGYVKGVGKILTDRLKIQSEEAMQRARLDLMASKSATGLASKALETSLNLAKHHENLFNTFMQLQAQRDRNTWSRIKGILRDFKW